MNCAATNLRVGARQQLLAIDRAHQIIVHAHVESLDHAAVIVGIDDDQDRHLPGSLQRPQLRAQSQAVIAVEIEIDEDELVILVRRHEHCLLRIVDAIELMAAEQRHLDAVMQQAAIVDQEHPAGFVELAAKPAAAPDELLVLRSVPRQKLVGQHLQPDQALDPAEQGDVVDRLGQEVVGAGLEAAHPVLGLVEGRHHDHRDVQGGRIGLDAAAHLDAVHSRHHHVEQDDVRLDPLDAFERVEPVHRRRHLEILGHELRLEQANIGQDVVHNQDFGSHTLPFRKPSMVSRKLTTEIGFEI